MHILANGKVMRVSCEMSRCGVLNCVMGNPSSWRFGRVGDVNVGPFTARFLLGERALALAHVHFTNSQPHVVSRERLINVTWLLGC